MTSRTSLGRKLPGMQDVASEHSTGISPTEDCKQLLQSSQKVKGSCVQVKLLKAEEKMIGASINNTSWPAVFKDIKEVIDEGNPSFFVIFRSECDILLIKHIPDNAPVSQKMIYASSTSSLKSFLLGLKPERWGVTIEEFNTSKTEEVSFAYYEKSINAPKPLTEMEKLQKDVAKLETAGGYSFLAQFAKLEAGKEPVPLPGLSKGGVPENLQKHLGVTPGKTEKASSSPSAGIATLRAKFENKSSFQENEKENVNGKSSFTNEGSGEDEEDEVDDGAGPFFTLSDLVEVVKNHDYEKFGIVPGEVEKHLPSKEYKNAFGTTKSKFLSLATWKQQQLKKDAGIF